MRDADETLERELRTRARRRPLRDVFVVACLAVIVILAYPKIQPFIPEDWQSEIAEIAPMIPSQVSPALPAQRVALVIRNVNVRASPSTGGAVVSTLARGRKVPIIEQRGNWTRVQIDGEGNKPPMQGWAFNSFLKFSGDDETKTAERE